MLFSAEHRTDLEYPVKDTRHHLFVKLRALLKNRRPVKIAQPEQIRSSLGCLRTDLRRVDFRKALLLQKFPESPADTLLYLKARPFPHIAQRNGTHIQFCFQGSLQLPFINRKRLRLRRTGKDFYVPDPQLLAVRRARLIFYCSADPDTGALLYAQRIHIRFSCLPDCLDQSVPFS